MLCYLFEDDLLCCRSSVCSEPKERPVWAITHATRIWKFVVVNQQRVRRPTTLTFSDQQRRSRAEWFSWIRVRAFVLYSKRQQQQHRAQHRTHSHITDNSSFRRRRFVVGTGVVISWLYCCTECPLCSECLCCRVELHCGRTSSVTFIRSGPAGHNEHGTRRELPRSATPPNSRFTRSATTQSNRIFARKSKPEKYRREQHAR